MIRLLIVITISVVFFAGCGLEVNTVDPQASANIDDSKKRKVFVKEYYHKNDSGRQVGNLQCWVENGWKNSVKNGKAVTKKEAYLQLVIKFLDSEYITGNGALPTDWKLMEDNFGYFGSVNKVFDLAIGKNLPDTFFIKIKKFRSDSILSKFSVFSK